MSSVRGRGADIVADNGYGAIRLTANSVQVLGWYTPPWLGLLMTPLSPVAGLAALWIMFRTLSPPAARYLAPWVDRNLEAFVDLFHNPVHAWLGRRDWDFGHEFTLSLMLGSLAAMVVVVIAARLFLDQNQSMRFLAYILRFPLRVEIWKDRIRIGRRSFQKTENQSFSADATSAVRNDRPRNEAYDRSLSIVFETLVARIPVANVFGIERAEGITTLLNVAMQASKGL